jgi:hypothetical protein
MNLSQLQALNDAEKDRYMALGRLFEHPSYKFLMEWAHLQVEECTVRELNAPTWDIVLLQRGARLAYTNLVKLEAITEAEFEGIAEERIQEAAEAKEAQSSLEEI